MKSSDEIKMVNLITLQGGEITVVCPHCKRIVYLPSGAIKGEQFHHQNTDCDSWFEVNSNARTDFK